jgi:hypothetical protein
MTSFRFGAVSGKGLLIIGDNSCSGRSRTIVMVIGRPPRESRRRWRPLRPPTTPNPPRIDWARGGFGQQVTSTYTVIEVTVVTMSSIAPGAPESNRENV